LPNENPGEIKVREIEAYASVADLIHAAIVANSGAASLKEVRPINILYFYPTFFALISHVSYHFK
jgi:hypothetical protein